MTEPWQIQRVNRPTVGVDIDGVLNLYPIPWIGFVNKILNAEFETLNKIKQVVDYETYKQLKTCWRTSDEKMSQRTREGAQHLLNTLRKMGYRVVLISKRPVDEIPELRTLTIDWLRLHKLTYDDIIFSKKKHLVLIDQFPDLSFMVEDHREIANQVAQYGFRVFLIDSIYNRKKTEPLVTRVVKLSEIVKILEEEHEEKAE